MCIFIFLELHRKGGGKFGPWKRSSTSSSECCSARCNLDDNLPPNTSVTKQFIELGNILRAILDVTAELLMCASCACSVIIV